MRKSKVNLDSYTHDELEDIMSKLIKDLDANEIKVYKKIKFINWKAKKEGKEPPYKFSNTKQKTKKEEKKEFIVPKVKTKVVSSWKVNTDQLKMPRWVNIPKNIKKEEVIGGQCLVKSRGKIRPVMIREENDEPLVVVEEEKYKLSWDQAWWIRNYAPTITLGMQEKRVRVE